MQSNISKAPPVFDEQAVWKQDKESLTVDVISLIQHAISRVSSYSGILKLGLPDETDTTTHDMVYLDSIGALSLDIRTAFDTTYHGQLIHTRDHHIA
jgi:hypothetical protein